MKWSWVEASIWTDNMLTALESGVRGGKWFSLIDKVGKLPNLESAWQKVRKNKGAAGIDRISIEKFGKKFVQYIMEIKQDLERGVYKPQAVKRVYIPKGGGKKRPLGIPTIKDRVVQAAIKHIIEPIFEKEFLDMSYGFRPGRGAKDALREVDKAIKEGYIYVLDADIQGYFDNIPHDLLMKKVEKKISDGKLLTIIESFLTAKIMEEMNEWIPDKGSPQGGVLSPLLANIYLHDLDVLITKAGFKMFRYADDFVILTKEESDAQRAYTLVKTWITEHGLTIHPDKTHIGNCMIEGQGFEFLGYRFESGRRTVRKKSMDKFKDKIREKTKRTYGKSLEMVIENINPILKGWFGYFKHAHKWTFSRLDGWIRRRLRSILRTQEKRPGRGKTLNDHMRWPNNFFKVKNLISLEEAWVRSLCQSRSGNR
jgi:RNA-directed DNA polymerase